MKKVLLFGLLFGILVTGTSAYLLSSGGVINTTGSTGEGNCSGCHGGGTGITTVSITGSPAFVGNKYIPLQTYTITVTVSNSAYSKFGFDSEILTTTNVNAGSITAAFAGAQLVNTTRVNVTHTSPQSGTGFFNFSYVWVAPASGVCRIYAAGNAVNLDGNTTGDSPSTALVSLSPNTTDVREDHSTSFSGLRVYPNPVVSDFKLQYNLIEDGEVKAALYDIQGKEISEIVNEKQNAGYHLLNTALPSDLPKGVYLVKLSLNGKSSAQRLIITQ